MYHMHDFMPHVEDLSAFLSRLMVSHHGPGFRENCELVVAYARTMHCLTIKDQLPLLRNLRPGGVTALGLTDAIDPPIPSSEEDQLSDESTCEL